jgi:hypothetical protein
MNRFEQAVYDCMVPTAQLLEETTKPLHRAILLNFWRHVHLEGAGDCEKIVAPDILTLTFGRPFRRSLLWGFHRAPPRPCVPTPRRSSPDMRRG